MKKFFILFLLILSCNTLSAFDDAILLNKSMQILGHLRNSQWDEVYNYFDSTMMSVFPQDKIKQTWETIGSQLGDIKTIVDTTYSNYQTNRLVILTIKFKVMYADLRFVFNQKAELSGFYIAPNYNYSTYQSPNYVDKSKFIETKYKFGKKGWELDAVLTLPVKKSGEENRIFPVVILVHGSGPNDMDETIGPNKPFKDLAWGLASNGIAVFRYNKRTYQYPDKILNIIQNFTVWDETVEDVTLAIEKLTYTPDIDPKQIYILGHSLGGFLIPKIYQCDKSLAGFIIMAGSSRPLEDIVLEQYNYIFGLDGEITEDEQKQLDTLKLQVNLVKSKKLTKEIPHRKLPLGISSSYWLDLREYKPLDIIKLANKKKILVLQGERDYHVTMKDFELWKSALQNNPNAGFKTYPKLNHLFMEGQGKSNPDEYLKVNHIPEYVIKDIVEFIFK